MATVKGALPELRAYSIYLANVQKLKSYREPSLLKMLRAEVCNTIIHRNPKNVIEPKLRNSSLKWLSGI